MDSDGRYRRVSPEDKPRQSAQVALLETVAKLTDGLN
jgi:hypothetical protein